MIENMKKLLRNIAVDWWNEESGHITEVGQWAHNIEKVDISRR